MLKWHIEGNWYLVKLDNCWALGQKHGSVPTRIKGKEYDNMDLTCYHYSAEKVLTRYIEIHQDMASQQAGEDTLKELVDKLSSARESAAATVSAALREWNSRP